MVFKSTEWEYTNMATETEYTPVEAGDQYLYIQDATYYPDACHYDIEFKSLSNGAVFRIRYFMLTKEGKQNGFTGKVLHTLGKAINNEDVVLAPADIIGAVVRANVQFTVPKTEGGKAYPKVEEFHAVPEDLLQYSGKPDQYFLPE